MKAKLTLTLTAALLAGCQSSMNSSQTKQTSKPSPPVAQAQNTAEPSGTAGLEVLDQAEVNLHKEELVVGKKEVSNGGVLVRTVVKSEEVKQPVELRREEYVVERIPAGSAKDMEARSGKAFDAREIYIPLMKEEPVTGKRTLLTETITLGKKVQTTEHTVTSPVRTESVKVVNNPDLSDPKFASVPRRSNGSATLVSSAAGSAAGAETGSESSISTVKEELMVGKLEKDAGGVYLQKMVETENVSKPVSLRREEYTIDRKPASTEIASSEFTPREIKINLTREEPVAETRSYLTEVVRVRKQTQTDKQFVTGVVRQETAEIVPLGESNSAVGGAASGESGAGISDNNSSATDSPTRDEILESHVKASLEKPFAGNSDGYHHIIVSAKDGEVTLRGDVTSESEKKTLTKRVKEMSGVRSVDNKLRVIKASEPER